MSWSFDGAARQTRWRRTATVWVICGGLVIAFANARAADAPPPLERARAAMEKGDRDAAIKILRAEAANGDVEAANAVGEMLVSARTAKDEFREAAQFFQQAAEKGHPAGSFNLARLLEEGAPGVPKDQERARFLLQSAAESGHPGAQARLGSITEAAAEKSPDKRGFAEAKEWYEKAAAKENPDALLALARFYDHGLGGVPTDAAKAAQFCLRAAKAGSVVAMNEMGVRYQRGAGIATDNVAAIGWFMLAAQYNLPAAHVNLGNCYETGNGTKPDYDKAGSHYAAAAKQGFGPAQLLLAKMIEEGRGTKANLVHAFVLYSRAAGNGVQSAGERRDAVKEKLSGAQLSEAEKLLAKDAATEQEGK